VSRLIWTPPALADVQRLYRLLATKDAGTASRAVRAIREGANTLAGRPHIGRPADDMNPEFREWPIRFGDSGYLALYRLDDGQVSILALRHQREAGYGPTQAH